MGYWDRGSVGFVRESMRSDADKLAAECGNDMLVFRREVSLFDQLKHGSMIAYRLYDDARKAFGKGGFAKISGRDDLMTVVHGFAEYTPKNEEWLVSNNFQFERGAAK